MGISEDNMLISSVIFTNHVTFSYRHVGRYKRLDIREVWEVQWQQNSGQILLTSFHLDKKGKIYEY
jgi:hypothetical protein